MRDPNEPRIIPPAGIPGSNPWTPPMSNGSPGVTGGISALERNASALVFILPLMFMVLGLLMIFATIVATG